MADVRPFRALRFTPKAGELRELTCPPYDIIDESQRLSYLKRNPHNIIRLEPVSYTHLDVYKRQS